jgi:hypothetical protein
MKKTKAAEPLATYWMPPHEVGAPIACLASTYTFHAALFEDDLLPRFLGLRFDNTERERIFIAEREDRLASVTAAVFVDAAHVDGRQTTGRWSQVPVRVRGGCQHSKVTVLVWEKLIRVLVSSANLTATGYRKNREVAACLDFFEGKEAAPRELFNDILDFFEDELLELGEMPPGTRARLVEAIKSTRQRARNWALPNTTASLPATTFIPVTPKRTGRAGHGVIGPLLDAWGSKIATSICVMTPFIGDSAAAMQTTMKELFRIARVRNAEGHLILGGRHSEENDEQFTVNLPDWFRDVWAKAWKIGEDEISIYVIPPQRDDEKAERSLHAKAIMVSSDERTLLLVGSSNFSPHGLGIGTFNVEANLCYVAREKDHLRALEAALPVDWEDDLQEEVRWPAEQEPFSDDPPSTAPPPPLGFQWATFHEESGTLSISVDASNKLPETWSIWIPGRDAPVFDTTRDTLTLANGAIVIALGEANRAHRITAVTIRWIDELNVQQEARLPTLVDDDAELLPPEGLHSLQSDDIVKCLLSGKDPIEWAEEDNGSPEAPKKKKGNKNYDLLKTLDTNSYVIYRTRRLGRGFAALSQRILATLRTQTAMRHRLERDPVGPLMLARAIAAEGKEMTGAGRAATLFALVELTLTLSYVALRVDPKGKLGLRPIFDGVRRSIDELAQSYDYEPQGPDPLKRYVKSVRERCDSASNEGLNAG